MRQSETDRRTRNTTERDRQKNKRCNIERQIKGQEMRYRDTNRRTRDATEIRSFILINLSALWRTLQCGVCRLFYSFFFIMLLLFLL